MSFLSCFLLSACRETPTDAESCPAAGADKLYAASDENFFLTVHRRFEGSYNTDNRIYSYKYTGYMLELTPLTLEGERQSVEIAFAGRRLRFDGRGRVFAENEDFADPDGVTFVYGGKEREVYPEVVAEADVPAALDVLREKRGEAFGGGGRFEVRFLLNPADVYIFAGFYEGEVMRCAVIFDSRGQYLSAV